MEVWQAVLAIVVQKNLWELKPPPEVRRSELVALAKFQLG